jgi:branched-chain amino acid aminotransferase
VAEDVATAHGCDQVCFLDSEHNTYIEELGGMNVMFVKKDGTIVTPELTGTILEGITRSSLIDVARSLGHAVEERRVSAQEWRDGVTSGEIAEVFACGTAAVITPIGTLVDKDGSYASPNQTGEVTMKLRDALLDIQYGRAEDSRGWTYRLV